MLRQTAPRLLFAARQHPAAGAATQGLVPELEQKAGENKKRTRHILLVAVNTTAQRSEKQTSAHTSSCCGMGLESIDKRAHGHSDTNSSLLMLRRTAPKLLFAAQHSRSRRSDKRLGRHSEQKARRNKKLRMQRTLHQRAEQQPQD